MIKDHEEKCLVICTMTSGRERPSDGQLAPRYPDVPNFRIVGTRFVRPRTLPKAVGQTLCALGHDEEVRIVEACEAEEDGDDAIGYDDYYHTVRQVMDAEPPSTPWVVEARFRDRAYSYATLPVPLDLRHGDALDESQAETIANAKRQIDHANSLSKLLDRIEVNDVSTATRGDVRERIESALKRPEGRRRELDAMVFDAIPKGSSSSPVALIGGRRMRPHESDGLTLERAMDALSDALDEAGTKKKVRTVPLFVVIKHREHSDEVFSLHVKLGARPSPRA